MNQTGVDQGLLKILIITSVFGASSKAAVSSQQKEI